MWRRESSRICWDGCRGTRRRRWILKEISPWDSLSFLMLSRHWPLKVRFRYCFLNFVGCIWIVFCDWIGFIHVGRNLSWFRSSGFGFWCGKGVGPAHRDGQKESFCKERSVVKFVFVGAEPYDTVSQFFLSWIWKLRVKRHCVIINQKNT